MPQVTETEYETVEKQVQRYKCDNCAPVAGFEGKWNESFMNDESVLENTR